MSITTNPPPCDAQASTPTRRKAILYTHRGCMNIPNPPPPTRRKAILYTQMGCMNIPNAPPPTRRKAIL